MINISFIFYQKRFQSFTEKDKSGHVIRMTSAGDLLDQLKSCQQGCDAAQRRGNDLEREMQQMKDEGWMGMDGDVGGNPGNMMVTSSDGK